MRGLGLFDVLIIVAVIALLVFLGSKDFLRYQERSAAPAATPSPQASER